MICSLYTLLSNNSNLSVCFLEDTKELFTEKIVNPLIEYNSNFKGEIDNFKVKLSFKRKLDTFKFWPLILPCISGYFIQKGYFKLIDDRIQSFTNFKLNPFSFQNLDEDEYIELRSLGLESLFKVQLIYHIERCELFALKKPYSADDEINILMEREKANYVKIQHPYVPKFYGTVKNHHYPNCLFIEFINGQTLDKIQFDKYDENDIIIIIYKLLFIVEYFHSNNFIIRDLKPTNLMITGTNNIVMIDFDRIIDKSTQPHSQNFYNEYASPEVNDKGLYSDKSDIYSLGKVIEFIIENTNQKMKISAIDDIMKQFLQENADERPPVKDIIANFTNKFQDTSFEHLNKTKIISSISSILSISNNSEAQFNLGAIYEAGEFIERNINKAICFYSLASNQNHPKAQYSLGLIHNLIEKNNEIFANFES